MDFDNTGFEAAARELVGKMTLAEKCSQLKYNAPAIERLGVPAYNWWNEALHGVARTGVATVFPQAIASAATFDDDTLYEEAHAIGYEGRAKYNEYRSLGGTEIYQGITYWSPNINIFRDPRWGRGHETYGEDPYLTGRMGAAFVLGIEGKDRGGNPLSKYKLADATLKHYAVHSGPEADRHGFDAKATPQDMFETYLEAFRYCVEKAHPSAVMGAYNRTNGEPCCASPTLFGILHEKFGFDGYIVSDCGAINDINAHHHVTDSPEKSSALAINAGCDLNCGSAYASMLSAFESGLVDEETITEACVRLFTARFRLGMFADDCEYDKIGYGEVCSSEHKSICRKMARESIVLLENDDILPLSNDERLKIAVIGPAANDKKVLLGNYNGTPDEYVTIYEGIRRKARGAVYYSEGSGYFDGERGDWDEKRYTDAYLAAKRADVVIMCVGLSPDFEGEEGPFGYGGDKRGIELPASQRELYERVLAAGTPIITVNVSGSAMALGRQSETSRAVLQFFYGGQYGGEALAEILFGETNPSGRLPVTFYRSTDELPPFDDYSMDGRTYKFYKGEPLYPFGHGLSYTTFEYSCLTAHEKDGGTDGAYSADFTLDVKNTGERDGDEVVLLYVHETDAECRVPIKKLIGFCRVSVGAGETVTATIKTEPDAFCHVNEAGETAAGHTFEVMCGNLSLKIQR